MPIDSSPSQVATNALQSLPFGSIIGGPLKACIEAQAMAAKTSWNFIQEVGLNVDPKTGEKKALNVSFQFLKDGRIVQLNVPLLTIVPIPYIAINSIDISFKANINASSSSSKVENESSTVDVGTTGTTSFNFGLFKTKADFHANYSSKKDSTATQDSKYSVEYTMDIAVKAGQDSMPAGLAKVLELLGNSLDISDPSGKLDVNALEFRGAPDEKVILIATYKNREGVFQPDKIQIPGQTGKVDGDSMVFELPVVTEKATSYIVGVSGEDKKIIVKTIDSITEQQNRELKRMDNEKAEKARMDAMALKLKERRTAIDAENAQALKTQQDNLNAEEKK